MLRLGDCNDITRRTPQVHIGPDDWMSEPALHSKKPWRAVLARRRWRSGYNAGGGPNYMGEYLELQTKVREDFTLTEKASVRLKAPPSAFTFKRL